MVFRLRNNLEDLASLKAVVHQRNVREVELVLPPETTRDFDDVFVHIFVDQLCDVQALRLYWYSANLSPVVKLLLHPENRVAAVALHNGVLTGNDIEAITSVIKHPNNNLERLNIENATVPGADSEMARILGSLKHPNNRLKEFGLQSVRLSRENIDTLIEAMESSECKLEQLTLVGIPMSEPYLKAVVSAIASKRLVFLHLAFCLDDSKRTIPILDELAKALERPDNNVEKLIVELPLNFEEVRALLAGLRSPHNRVAHLELIDQRGVYWNTLHDDLFLALSSPSTRMRLLKLHGPFNDDIAGAVGRALQTPSSQLEELHILSSFHFTDGTTEIARALQSPTNRLRILSLSVAFGALTPIRMSFRSPFNRLQELNLTCSPAPSMANLLEGSAMLKTVRRSLLTKFYANFDLSFSKAYSSRWSLVLYVLMSVGTVPRLGQKSSFRLLPMNNFILLVTETLGWPLFSLRADSRSSD